MLYRCSNCDYLGETYVENEYGETLCPECDEDCFEFEEMTKEEEKILEDFFKHDFIPCPDKNPNEHKMHNCLWDDWDLLKSFLDNNPGIFMYTLLDSEEDTAYIAKGKYNINRIGYYLSTEDIYMKDDVRYC